MDRNTDKPDLSMEIPYMEIQKKQTKINQNHKIRMEVEQEQMYSFEFNGIKSSDLAIYMLNFNGFSAEGTIDNGGEVVFNTSKPVMSDRWNFHGSSVESPLTTTFQIGKWDCGRSSIRPFTREEFAFLKSWLERRDGYRFLRILKPGYEHTWFHCQIQVKPIQYNDKKLGAELTVTCDSGHGYSDIQTWEIICNEEGMTFDVYNDSDEIGSLLIDRTEILLKSDAKELKITNQMDSIYSPTPYETKIKNCIKGEWIQIANRQILSECTSSAVESLKHTNETIANDFNYKYPRLICLADKATNLSDGLSCHYSENRVNRFTISGGACELVFTFRTVRTVMP